MNRGIFFALLLTGACGTVAAHELSPTQLFLLLTGSPQTFTLANGPGETNCTTSIEISVDRPDIIRVSPVTVQYSTPPDDSATFTVYPLKLGKAVITVKWLAGVSNTCNGQGSPAIAVTVGDVPPPPPPVYEKIVVEPVSMATGAYLDYYLDLRLRGPLAIRFERYYNSALNSQGEVSSRLGPNWIHSYDLALLTDSSTARISWFDGQALLFTKNGAAWTQTTSDAFSYQLLQSGTSYRMLDPFTHLVYTFDGVAGTLQSIQDRNGNTQTLTYTSGRLSRVTDGLGASLDFSYTSGNLSKVTDQSGRSVTFTYSFGTLISATDAAGQVTTFTYSAGGLMTAYRRARGNTPYTNTYDANGRIATQKDAAGNTTSFAFNTATGVSTMTNPLSQVSTYTHTGGNLVRDSDPAGNAATMSYDSNNRQTARTDAAGNATKFTFNPNGLVASATTPDGTTTYSYAATQAGGFTYYDLSGVTYPDGSTETFQYDQGGNVTTRVSRTGQQWTSTYNSFGQPLTLTAPTGAKTIFTYTQDGTSMPASVQFPDTSATTLKLDSLKRLIAKQRSDGASTTYTWDAYDHVLTQTNAVGAVTTFTYDANGLLASVKDGAGGVMSFTRTGTDQIATVTDGAGRALTIRYDALDRPSVLTYGDGSTLQIGYDAAGNATSLTDGEGKVWKQGFDPTGIETSFTTPLGGAVQSTLDQMGRVSKTVTAAGKTTVYAYDAMGRPTRITDPLQHDSTIQYGKNGELLGLSVPGAITSTYARDAAGNLTGITDPNGALWSFTNDGTGRTLTVTDPLGQTVSYQRDARGRIAKVTLPLGTMTATLDAAGRLTSATYSDGTAISYGWNANGRLTSATGLTFQYDASNLLSNSNGLAVARDPVSRVTSVTLAAGKAVTYKYDKRGLVTAVTDWLGGVTTFAYDDASRLLSITRPNGVITTYTYDADSDIASIQEAGSKPLASLSVTRDKRGYVVQANRTVPLTPAVSDLAAAQSVHTYDAAGQIADYHYDAMGRRTADNSRSYVWDLASRLTAYTAGGDSSTLTYNGAGLPASVTHGGVARQLVWNFALSLPSVSVVRVGAADSAYYVHTPEGRLLYSADTAGKRLYYHFDEMGNTLFLTDDSGAVTDQFAYSEYGAPLAVRGGADQLFLFAGQYGVLSLGNGLYAARQRVYDSRSGEFLSRDAIVHLAPQFSSAYSYAAGNPLYYFDVTGAEPGTTAADVGQGVITGVNDVGGASGIAATHIGDEAQHLENLINNLHIPEGLTGAQELKEGSYLIKLTKQAGKLKTLAKPLKVAGKVGKVAQVAAVAIESYKFNSAIKATESEDDANRAGNEKTYQNAFANIQQLYDLGKITAVQRNTLKLQAQFAYEDGMMACDFLLETNLIFDGAVYLKNSLGTFVPVPLNWIGLAPEEKVK